MGAEFLASPFFVLVTLVVVIGASAIHYSNDISKPVVSPRRLLVAYLSVVFLCSVIAAFSSYVPQAEAATKWHVSSENYWEVQVHSYLVNFTLTACIALIGIALVGLPIVIALGRRGLATVPWVLVASVPVSVATAIFASAGDHPTFRHLAYTIKYFGGMHLLLALSFCLGAGLPWRRGAYTREA
jgi:hypothetical protein